jgi:predicted anti-sigma-YlaC factor YlaD
MTCRKFRKLLTPWLDGELKPEQAAELQAWYDGCGKVRQCSDCRKLVDEHISFHRLYSSLPQSGFPAHLHHRIMSEIKSREPVYHRKEIRVRWQTIPATLAIIMSLYFGSLVGVRTFFSDTEPQTESAELYSFGENSLITDFYANGEIE